MPPTPYDNCPCGSGKKFKWCCAAYWDKIEQGLDLYQQGQLENALRVMEALVREHPKQPQAWGYYAHVLFREGHMERAEETLQKAFDIEPNFPMGLLLRGLFRQSEGEVIGALLLYRKAAEAYPPEAHDQLAQVYEMIARNELMLNRLVACRAALDLAVHHNPGDEDLRMQLEYHFGEQSRTPTCARKKYVFRPTARPVAAVDSNKLTAAKAAFEVLTADVPTDPAAWFNLGLCRAWLGELPGALDALNKSIELEYDDEHAEEAAALAEVTKCGHGMEADSDYHEHRVYYQIRDPQAVVQLLEAWGREGRMVSPQSDESGQSFACLLVKELPNLLDMGTTVGQLTANVVIRGNVMRLYGTDAEAVKTVGIEVRDRLQLAVGEPAEGTGPVAIAELAQEAVAYPIRVAQVEDAQKKMSEFAAAFFENTWAHRPLKALGTATPIDAAGSTLMRKRLLGVVKLYEDCLTATAPRISQGEQVVALRIYDFDRLRHKLGLEKKAGGTAPPAELLAAAAVKPVAAVAPKKDFSTMNVADLAALDRGELTGGELEEAMRAAMKLDARELAVHFAKAGVAKPADPARPDRYHMYLGIITGAIAEGDLPAALQASKDGAAYDAANNGGKRANEFGLRIAQLLARTGKADESAAAFDDLIARNPDEPKFYITATETMLSAKQGAKATAFAERGLEKAQASGNRDLEGACKEMLEAAKRMK